MLDFNEQDQQRSAELYISAAKEGSVYAIERCKRY